MSSAVNRHEGRVPIGSVEHVGTSGRIQRDGLPPPVGRHGEVRTPPGSTRVSVVTIMTEPRWASSPACLQESFRTVSDPRGIEDGAVVRNRRAATTPPGCAQRSTLTGQCLQSIYRSNVERSSHKSGHTNVLASVQIPQLFPNVGFLDSITAYSCARRCPCDPRRGLTPEALQQFPRRARSQ
jgi:hypothetical protein